MTDREAFYLTCALMMLVGFAIVGCSAIIGRRLRHSEVAGFVLCLGLACILMGPLMALIGPS